MKYRGVKKKIFRVLESDSDTNRKYFRVRKLFARQFNKHAPVPEYTNKEKVESVLPVITKIFFDSETPNLFKQVMPSSEMSNTLGFIEFLKKIVQ